MANRLFFSFFNHLTLKIEKKFEEKDVSSYISLPSSKADLDRLGYSSFPTRGSIQSGGFVLSNRDSFQIRTMICSTKLTQNRDLLGILKYDPNNPQSALTLKQSMCNLMKSDREKAGEEIVKVHTNLSNSLAHACARCRDRI